MRISKPAAWAALGLVFIAGCSKGGGGNTTAAGGPGAPPASGPDVAISAADLPRLKAGYWETTSTTNGQAGETHRFCSSGKPVAAPAQMTRGCSSFSYRKTFLGGFVIDANCAEGPVSSKLHMTVSGDFNAAYQTDSQAEIDMQGRPASSFASHSVSRWVGACPAGTGPDE